MVNLLKGVDLLAIIETNKGESSEKNFTVQSNYFSHTKRQNNSHIFQTRLLQDPAALRDPPPRPLRRPPLRPPEGGVPLPGAGHLRRLPPPAGGAGGGGGGGGAGLTGGRRAGIPAPLVLP